LINVLKHIDFVFDYDEIILRLRSKLEYLAIPKAHSEQVLYEVLGVFKVKKYELIKNHKRLNIDYETFRNTFQFDRIVRLAGDREIDFGRYHVFKNIYKIDPKDGLFSKMLADIGIEDDEITDFAIQYAASSMFIQTMISDGEFTDTENITFESEMLQGWKNIFRQNYLPSFAGDDEHAALAKLCLYKTIDQSVTVSNSSVAKVNRPEFIGDQFV